MNTFPKHQIVTHFTDNDLYTFTIMYFALMNYPRAEIVYNFFDRNNTVYPKGFAEEFMKQMKGMESVKITDEEVDFMIKSLPWLPTWFIKTFLRGYRFDSKQLNFYQDEEGHLLGTVKGAWIDTIMWEMPILSTISEMMHYYNGDIETLDMEKEKLNAHDKIALLLYNGVNFSDMSTRRRISFDYQEMVISTFVDYQNELKKMDKRFISEGEQGSFIGTSNVYFAMKYNLKPIGTMAHQVISFEESVSGLFECNYQVMKKWFDTFNGNVGIFLPDTFTHKLYFKNLSLSMAKAFDGNRIDSGNEEEATEQFIEKYKSFNIDPKTKSIIFSNALDGKRAIELHKFVNGRMKDSYGIGTWLAGKTETIRNMNIVLKATNGRITETREWHDLCKLSNDIPKAIGSDRKKMSIKLQLEMVNEAE